MRVIEGRLSRARRSRGRATSVAAFLLLATSLAAQTPEIPPGVSGEGALQNDVFTPTSPEAIRLLDAGDQAFLKARAPGANAQGTDAKAQGAGANAQGTGVKAQGAGAKAQGAGAKAQGPDAKAQGAGGPSPSAFDEALDDWHAALAVGAENDAVAIGADALRALEALFPDSDRSLARRTESVETAVVRRIATLDPSLRELWRARFEGLAGAALAAAGSDAARLARVAHDHALTAAAARASLMCFDLAFEAADGVAARTWLERARSQIEAIAQGSGADRGALDAAVTRRSAALESYSLRRSPGVALPASAASAMPPWETALHLRVALHLVLGARAPESSHSPVRRPRSGIALLADGTALVQSAETLYVASPSGDVQSVDLTSAAGALALSFASSFADARTELTLTPATDGTRVVVVAGRALGSHGNALLCLERGAAGDWRAEWGIADPSYRVRDRESRALDDVLEPGLWEFEPGPAIDGDRVYVQARQWVGDGAHSAATDDGHIRAWCVSLDLATGAVRWKRWLAAGATLASARSQRSFEARAAPSPPEALAIGAGRVFVSTGLGLGALLDAGDGELAWSIKCQRRSPEVALRFGSSAPVRAPACPTRSARSPALGARAPTRSELSSDRAADANVWLWTPADSECAYRLRDGADTDGRGSFAEAPLRLPPGSEILAGDACGIVVIAAGARPSAVSIEDLESGARADAIAFGREEAPPATALLAPTRVLVATDRALYAFDRERELYLLDRVPLPGAERFERPALAARGDRVYAATRSSLWILRAE